MKRQYYVVPFVLSLSSITLHGLFDYDRAVQAAQKGDFDKADALLSSLITDRPDRSDLLYDAGVVASGKKDFQRARACFEHAYSVPSCAPVLQEQAHFNCGNVCVELKDLKGALREYEKVLQINSHNEQARHNLEVVKKMLEQQQQREQNKDKKNQDKQDNKNQDKQDNKNQNDQNQQDRTKDKNQSRDDERNKNQRDQKDQNKQDQGKNDQQNNERADDHNKNKQDDHNSSERNQQQEQQSQPEQERNQQKQQQQQQGKTQQQQGKSGGQQAAHEQQPGGMQKQDNHYDTQVMGVLDAIEKRDAQANKQLMAAQMKQAVGAYDTNKNNY
jgi:Ca-activated chloride channel homolog